VADDLAEAVVDLPEAGVDLDESSIDLLEAALDLRELSAEELDQLSVLAVGHPGSPASLEGITLARPVNGDASVRPLTRRRKKGRFRDNLAPASPYPWHDSRTLPSRDGDGCAG
jgi:hypothetical protein